MKRLSLHILFSIIIATFLLMIGFPTIQRITADSLKEPELSAKLATAQYTGFNEVTGISKEKFSTEFWFTWYDNKTMTSWIYIANPDASQTANVEVYIGNTLRGTYSIAPGKVINSRFFDGGVGMQNGPVRVVSANTVKIIAS